MRDVSEGGQAHARSLVAEAARQMEETDWLAG